MCSSTFNLKEFKCDLAYFVLLWKVESQKIFLFFPRVEHLHTKNTAEIIVTVRFGKCQSIKEVGFRRFLEGLY